MSAFLSVEDMAKIITCHYIEPEKEAQIKVEIFHQMIPIYMDDENISFDQAYDKSYKDLKDMYEMKLLAMTHDALSETVLTMKNLYDDSKFKFEHEKLLLKLIEARDTNCLDQYLDSITKKYNNLKFLLS